MIKIAVLTLPLVYMPGVYENSPSEFFASPVYQEKHVEKNNGCDNEEQMRVTRSVTLKIEAIGFLPSDVDSVIS